MAKPPKVTPEQLDEFRSLVFEVLPDMLAEYIDDVRMSEDVDDKRKFMAWATAVVGAEAKKEDQKPALPVFNFQFSLGGVQAQATEMVEVIDQATGAIEAPPPADPAPILVPDENLQEVRAAFEQLSQAKPC